MDEIIRGIRFPEIRKSEANGVGKVIALIERESFIIRGFCEISEKHQKPQNIVPCHIYVWCYPCQSANVLVDLDAATIQQGNNEFCNPKSLEFIYQLEKQRQKWGQD